jgi:error-prone DNA polymerase
VGSYCHHWSATGDGEGKSALRPSRETGLFHSQGEFATRTGLGGAELTLLAEADAFHALEGSRRRAHWDALPGGKPRTLYEALVEESVPVERTELTPAQETTADYQSTGLSLRARPLSFIRTDLEQCRVVTTSSLLDCENDRKYRVAGLVLLRQRPSTAKGITFMTIEDETGTTNLVVHVNVWEKSRTVARRATAIIAHGVLQRKDGIVHLVVDRIEDLTMLLGEVQNKSRDFQ